MQKALSVIFKALFNLGWSGVEGGPIRSDMSYTRDAQFVSFALGKAQWSLIAYTNPAGTTIYRAGWFSINQAREVGEEIRRAELSKWADKAPTEELNWALRAVAAARLEFAGNSAVQSQLDETGSVILRAMIARVRAEESIEAPLFNAA